jgi:hypothetical protein
MATTTQLQSVRSANTSVQLLKPLDDHTVSYHFTGRLIQITLAVYLLPAFLVVAVVGGLGILILKMNQLIINVHKRHQY